MKPSLLSLTLLLLIVNSAFAHKRNSRPTAQEIKQQKQFVLHHLLGNGTPHAATANKTTSALAERLIAKSTYSYILDSSTLYSSSTWGKYDSSRYLYGSNGSSFFDYSFMYFDNDCERFGNIYWGFFSRVNFLGRNDQPNILCDTSYMLWHDPYLASYPYGVFTRRYTTYDLNYNILDFRNYFDTILSGYRFVNTFYTPDAIATAMAYRQNTSSGWDTTEFRTFNYTGNLLESDVTQQYIGGGVWAPEEKNIYTYDSNGHLVMVQYQEYDSSIPGYYLSWQYNMTYYPSNKLKTYKSYMDTGTTFSTMTLELNIADSFGWTGTVNFWTYLQEKDYSGSATNYQLTESYKHLTAVDSLPDTLYSQISDGGTGTMILNAKTWYQYDAFKQPTTAIYIIYDSTTSAYDSTMDVYHFYYEQYMSNGVPIVTQSTANDILVYPNPTTNDIYISQTELKNGTRVVVQLYNMAWQAVHNETIQWQHNTETLSLGGLPAGVYLLTLNNGTDVFRKMVVKE